MECPSSVFVLGLDGGFRAEDELDARSLASGGCEDEGGHAAVVDEVDARASLEEGRRGGDLALGAREHERGVPVEVAGVHVLASGEGAGGVRGYQRAEHVESALRRRQVERRVLRARSADEHVRAGRAHALDSRHVALHHRRQERRGLRGMRHRAAAECPARGGWGEAIRVVSSRWRVLTTTTRFC